MSNEINYKNNPLNGVGLKAMVTQLVDHYGFDILFAYLNINCFKTNPSIDSSVKFLKKTDWAREKVEAFYLYQFKNLPEPSRRALSLPPRDRIIPDDHKPGEPAKLTLEEAQGLRAERERKAAEWERQRGHRSGSGNRFGGGAGKPSNSRQRKRGDESVSTTNVDPWASARNKSE